MSEERDNNRLIARVDELIKRQQEAGEEVPLLTDVVAHQAPPPAPEAQPNEEALAAELERALVTRLAPELDRRLGVLRADLEKELRRAVREAVSNALAVRKPEPPQS